MASLASQIVAYLLEYEVVRVCASCEQEMGRRVKVEPGQHRSHGYCRRHMLEYYRQADIDPGPVAAKDDRMFCPDLREHPEIPTVPMENNEL